MGGTVAQAGKGNPPVIHFTSDLGAGVSTTTALLMALYARERTGRGQQVETRMLNAAAYLHSDEFLRHPGKPPRRIADKGQHGLDALYRLYPAAQGWVFLAAPTDAEWRAFCQATGNQGWLEDPRFSTAEDRAAHDEALAGLIAALFKTRAAQEWERLLTAADVACAEAHEEFSTLAFTHEQLRETVGALTGFHPSFGEFTQVGPLVRLAGVPEVSRIRTSASGQDTAEVLRSLGFDPAAFPHLVSVKVAG
jgi:crotonobetainyl-CoA:carnitine CoA-transferase CaiB-like acyl-CoA transferase